MRKHRFDSYDKLYLNPAFVAACLTSRRPRHVLSELAGFRHCPHLSTTLHSPDPTRLTPLMRSRLLRLAEIIGFPAEDIFMPEGQA